MKAVHSITNQKFHSFEIVIVDDGSDDDTEEIVRKIEDTRVSYVKSTHRERGAARNLGLTKATGIYINYFDSDDVLNPCLTSLANFIADHDAPPVVFGSIENVSNDGELIGQIPRPYSDFKSNIIHNNFLACGSVFIKREIALKLPFSEDQRLSGTEDWELWLRIYAHYDFAECNEVIFKQVQHSSRSLNTNDSGLVELREKVFIEHINRSRKLLQRRFNNAEIDLLIADRYTLIALAQYISGKRKRAISFTIKAVFTSSRVVGRKRFWALLKIFFLG